MAITDLTGTKWKFNDDIFIGEIYEFPNLTFTSNKLNATGLSTTTFFRPTGPTYQMRYDTEGSPIIVLTQDGWESDGWKTIEITGGTDATDRDLIWFLSENATQVETAITELKPFLTNIANAIRTKKGTTAPINAQNFASEIASIESGGGGSSVPKLKSVDAKYGKFFDFGLHQGVVFSIPILTNISYEISE